MYPYENMPHSAAADVDLHFLLKPTATNQNQKRKDAQDTYLLN